MQYSGDNVLHLFAQSRTSYRQHAKEIIKEMKNQLIEKISSHSLQVAIIGLGYVGLPLALTFAEAGFHVTGIDVDLAKVDQASQGQSYISDVDSSDLRRLIDAGQLVFTTDFNALDKVDAISICVPTPLRKTREPDISYILAATQQVRAHLHAGQLIILESTTYPGTTDEVLLPELEATGLKVGTDFFLAFSPERIDPGNPHFGTKNTPKVVGGITPLCTELAQAYYGAAIDQIVPVSSARVAEMTKLLENTFRAVNIGLVNEIAIICEKLNINGWEVIDAAATKPFGFMRFQPGPGLGGHCIPVDPHYLSWKLRTLDYKARFIELAAEINSSMPHYVVNKITDALNEQRRSLNGATVLVLGVTYKRDVSDIRESPALDIIQDLLQRKTIVIYNDNYVSSLTLKERTLHSQPLSNGLLQAADCVVLVTDHSYYDISTIVQEARSVVDTRNMTQGIRDPKIFLL
jgi:UDP-N-acetyl-D-glucosamine dehydrogenase